MKLDRTLIDKDGCNGRQRLYEELHQKLSALRSRKLQ